MSKFNDLTQQSFVFYSELVKSECNVGMYVVTKSKLGMIWRSNKILKCLDIEKKPKIIFMARRPVSVTLYRWDCFWSTSRMFLGGCSDQQLRRLDLEYCCSCERQASFVCSRDSLNERGQVYSL